MIKENQTTLNLINVLVDIVVAIFSYIAAYHLRVNSNIFSYKESIGFYEYLGQVMIIVPVLIFSYYFFKLYTPQRLKSIVYEVGKITQGNVATVGIYLVYLYLAKQVDYSRIMVAIFVVVNITLTSTYRITLRYTLRYFRKKGYNIKRAILIGNSETGMDFLQKTLDNLQWGYKIVAIFEEQPNEKIQRKKKKKYEGEYIPRYRYKDISNYLQNHTPDEIVIAIKLSEYSYLSSIMNTCEKSGAKTLIIPDYLKYIPAKPQIEQIDDITIINIREVPLENKINAFVKRVFDIVVSLVALIITFPIMLITSVLIKLESEGPVIYRQKRVGYKKKLFEMYKFRSMKVQNEHSSSTLWTTENDDRKTKIGCFIRRTNIDELPQFFNVLKGDMSVIGPRPERPYFVDKFKEEIPKYMIKHQVRPGMTGWAQVNGYRGDTSIKKRIEHDLFYIENWSFLLDIKIFFLTIFRGNKNAY